MNLFQLKFSTYIVGCQGERGLVPVVRLGCPLRSMAYVLKNLKYLGMDIPILDWVLRPMLTVTTEWNTEETSDIYMSNKLLL